MTKRKLILIIADIVLLAVCIVQCALSTRDSAKVFEFKDTPDSITLVGEKGVVEIVKENEIWVVGEKKYPANEASIDSIIETISSIRTLDKVGSASSEAQIERYELNEGKKLTVVAQKDGMVLRSLEIGKEATASSQGYITIDGGKDIYLASGNLKYLLNKSVDELRTRTVWSLDKNEITGVTIEKADGSAWSVSKMGSGDDVVWNASGIEIEVDGAKATSWFGELATISTPSWYADNEMPEGEKIISAKVSVGFKTCTIDIYEIAPQTEDGKTKWWATCSETPYKFELAQYAVQKFQKNADELSK